MHIFHFVQSAVQLSTKQNCADFAAVAAELLDVYMGKLEEQLDRTEDTFRHMSSLLLLLQQFPGDMEPLFQQDVLTFFTNQLPVINQLRSSAQLP